ncbi:ArsR/SmtB family transcription factor [Nafulsella turpanensis]|uniref:ArsR/SmtB family transcription factor n=1 Tax=Nafulsella turpanensis TaxID=1265690 RepID=UPI000348232B|nr:metalloregulator ArsR/SmtB family transcription factor [Nafulsella turpanensis]
MGISKTSGFSADQNQLAQLAKALAHPARIAILQFLLDKKSCHCGDLVEVLPLSQATVSQHLKELKRIGILKGEVEGPRRCYCIDPVKWAAAKQVLEGFFSTPILKNPTC